MMYTCGIITGVIIILIFNGSILGHMNMTSIGSRKGSPYSIRRKRFLAYGEGGVVKLVFGINLPLKLSASLKGTLINFYNVQMQYQPPPKPLYWWSQTNLSVFNVRDVHRSFNFDNSRQFIYQLIETAFQSTGSLAATNTDCLKRFICDIAQRPFHTEHIPDVSDMLHKIINTIFMPTAYNSKEHYFNAYMAGLKSADCNRTFPHCSPRNDFMKYFNHFI